MSAAARLEGDAVATVATAAFVVVLFSVTAIPFGVDGLIAPDPEAVLVASLLVAVALPPAQRKIRALVERRRSMVLGVPARLVDGGVRMGASSALLTNIAETMRQATGAQFAAVRTVVGTATVGVAGGEMLASTVVFRGDVVAEVEVGGVEPGVRATIDQLAAAFGAPVANAIALERVKAGIADREETIALIERRRRRIVALEAAERSRVAAAVLAGSEPIFAALERAVAAQDLEAASQGCDELVAFLRRFSSEMRV